MPSNRSSLRLHRRSVSGVSSRPLLRGASLLLFPILLLQGCDSGPTEPEVGSVRILVEQPRVPVGGTIQLSAEALDRGGNPVSGQSFTWSSASPQFAQVDETGRVTGIAQGTAVIQAAVGAVSGAVNIQVLPPPVASVTVEPSEFDLPRGDEIQLEVTLRGADGQVLQGRAIDFSSSDPSVATVNSLGVVRGVGEGTATIRARVEDQEDSALVTVTPGSGPRILSVSPDPLRAGEEAEIRGENFSSTPTNNVVRVGEERATVLEASSTLLRIRIPTRVCFPEGLVPVEVSAGGDAAEPFLHPLDAPPSLELEVGEFHRVARPDDLCLRLPSSSSEGSYILGLQSLTEAASTRTPAVLLGRPAPGVGMAAGREDGLEAPAAGGVSFSDLARARTGSASPALPPRWIQHRQAKDHLRAVEERSLGTRLTPGGLAEASAALRSRQDPYAASTIAAVSADVRQGDTVQVNVPDVRSNVCADGIPVRAVVRQVGSRSIWLDDVENPEGGFTLGDFTRLSSEFEQVILPEISGFFGEPTDIDGNGRVVIVTSRVVNETTNALAFVVSSDFFPASCPGANGGEFYYARAPDPEGSITGPEGESRPYPVEDALADAPVLLAHETTHIIQFGRRITLPTVNALQTPWELEGQATFAEEVTGFRVLGLQPEQNLGFEVAFNSPRQEPEDWFRAGFTDLAVYHGFRSAEERSPGAPEGCGWQARTTAGDCQIRSGGNLIPYPRLVYGVPWSFMRWIADHRTDGFADGARGFHRRLIENPNQGFQTFEEVLGEPIPPLLARWAATLYTDGRLPPGQGDPELRFPSWDLRDIEEALVEPASLKPHEERFSRFDLPLTVAAGANAYLLVEDGPRGAFSIRARTTTGESLPPHMQLWVVRLR